MGEQRGGGEVEMLEGTVRGTRDRKGIGWIAGDVHTGV